MNFSKSYRFLLTVVLLCSFSIYASNVLKVSDTEVKIAKDKVVLKPKIEEASASEAVSYEPMKPIKIEDIERVENLNDTPNNVYSDQEKTDFYNSKNSGVIKIQTNVNIEDNNIDGYSDERRAAKEASRQKVDPEQERAQEKIDYYYNLKLNPPHQDPYDGSRDCADSDAGATDAYGDGCSGYTTYPSWCGGYDDDDFVSGDMCCACGGGADDGQGDLYCPDGDGSAYTWAYTGAYSSEVSWDLVAADGSTASVTGDGGSGSFCLADGAYTANMYDSYGDGWDGSVSFYDADGSLAVTIAMGACGYWDAYYGYCDGSQIYADVTFGGPPPVLGCTDATAENFDGSADTDDGTCTWNGGCSSSSYTACDNGDCKPNSYFCDGSSEYGNAGWGPDCSDGSDEGEHCCGGADGGDYSGTDCADLYDCASAWNGSAVIDCNEICDGDATVDGCGECGGDGTSCLGSEYSVTCDGGSWQSEVSWSLVDADGAEVASGGAPYSGDLTLEDGSYTLTGNDAYGDGWTGNSWNISSADGSLYTYAVEGYTGTWTFDLPGEVDTNVYGCMLEGAAEYNSEATVDDGSCSPFPGGPGEYFGCDAGTVIGCASYFCFDPAQIGDGYCDVYYGGPYGLNCAENGDDGCDCGTQGDDPDAGCYEAPAACEATECTLTMNDAYGDGWSGNTWSSGDQSATLASGSTGTAALCFDTSAANTYTCGGGSWSSEVSWTLDCTDGTSASGGAPADGCFGNCDTVVYGCTDADSCNYDADATDDDGSCDYGDCNGDCDGTAVVDACGECGGDGSACAGCAFANYYADSYCDFSNNTAECNYDGGDCCPGDCLDPGANDPNDFYDCATNGGDCLDCLDPDSADNNDGGDCFDMVLGCTDELADNYNSDANTDDGSCLYDGCAEGSSLGCSEQDIADGECAGDGWIGDGLCDGYSEAWGVNFCCYDLDGGDCTEAECNAPEPWDASITGLTVVGADYDDAGTLVPAVSATWDALLDGTSCEENGQITCWDGSCADSEADCPEDACASCEFDHTAYGSACCDTAWVEFGVDCATLESDFSWDCAGCECPGDVVGECGDGICGSGEDYTNCPADCEEPSACAASGGNDGWLGDGYCDSVNNNEGCDFDFGDCCPDECADNVAAGCPDNDAGCYGTISCGDCTVCSDPDSDDCLDGDNGGDFTYTPIPRSMDESMNNPNVAMNILTGEITYSDNYVSGNRAVSYLVTFSCDTCGFDDNGDPDGSEWSGTWEASTPEFLVYGFGEDDDVCVTVAGLSTDLGATQASDAVCATAGGGCDDADADGICDDVDDCVGEYDDCDVCNGDGSSCLCIAGDMNGDDSINVLDVVALVAIVLDGSYDECGDMNNDGSINVLDVVAQVAVVLGNGRDADATSAIMNIEGNTLNISGNGFIGAVQMTLSHGSDFSISLTDDAMVADYATSDNMTTLIVVAPGSEEIFTATGDYDVVEVIVANSSTYVDVIEPSSFTLDAAYPNPFNPSTSLSLNMPVEGYVSVKAYNLIGQVVGVIAEGSMDAGAHTMTWDASSLSSGVYLITAEYAGTVATQKVMLMK